MRPDEGWVAPSEAVFSLGLDLEIERLLDEEDGRG